MIADKTYPFSLPELPYAYDALEPYIDEETMRCHHDRHFKTYVDKLNKALEPYPEYHSWTLEELLLRLAELPEKLKDAVRDNGGGVYNHDMYFDLLAERFDGCRRGVRRRGKFQKRDEGGCAEPVWIGLCVAGKGRGRLFADPFAGESG